MTRFKTAAVGALALVLAAAPVSSALANGGGHYGGGHYRYGGGGHYGQEAGITVTSIRSIRCSDSPPRWSAPQPRS